MSYPLNSNSYSYTYGASAPVTSSYSYGTYGALPVSTGYTYGASALPVSGLYNSGYGVYSSPVVSSGVYGAGLRSSGVLLGGANAGVVGTTALRSSGALLGTAPATTLVGGTTTAGVVSSQYVGRTFGATNLRASIKGESQFEYVPYEKAYIEHVPQQRVEYVPVERRVTDYYTIEHQTEYVPQTRYETYVDYQPVVSTEYETVTRTEYVPVEKVEYVPRQRTDYVGVERVEEKVDYQAVQRSVVHGPSNAGVLTSSVAGGSLGGVVGTTGLVGTGGLVTSGVVGGGLVSGGLVSGGLVSSGLVNGGLVNGGLVNGGLVSGGLVSGGLVTSGVVGANRYVSGGAYAPYYGSSVVGATLGSSRVLGGSVVNGGSLLGGQTFYGSPAYNATLNSGALGNTANFNQPKKDEKKDK